MIVNPFEAIEAAALFLKENGKIPIESPRPLIVSQIAYNLAVKAGFNPDNVMVNTPDGRMPCRLIVGGYFHNIQ